MVYWRLHFLVFTRMTRFHTKLKVRLCCTVPCLFFVVYGSVICVRTRCCSATRVTWGSTWAATGPPSASSPGGAGSASPAPLRLDSRSFFDYYLKGIEVPNWVLVALTPPDPVSHNRKTLGGLYTAQLASLHVDSLSVRPAFYVLWILCFLHITY